MNNDAQATLPANKHYEAANLIPFSVLESLFGLALAALYCLLPYEGKNLLGYWVVAAFTYFKLYNSPRESIDIAMN